MSEVRNIGPKGCKRRIAQGGNFMTFSVVYLIGCLVLRPPYFLWIPALLSTFIGFICLLQAVEKTCIILAAKGIEMVDDNNPQKVQDNEIARQLRNKSTRLMIKAIMLTSLLGFFYFLVPKQ